MHDCKLVVLLTILLALCACDKEMVDEEFLVTEFGMPGILVGVEEYSYRNQSIKDGVTEMLFGRPKYDVNNRICFAYCNFIGDEANYTYSYKSNRILTTIAKKDGTLRKRDYTLSNNRIISCTETDNCDLAWNHRFEYEYNQDGRLIKIQAQSKYTFNESESEGKYTVEILWNNGNITKVTQIFDNGASECYTYEYKKFDNYNAKFPLIHHLNNIYIGGVQGIDEVLMAEGFFGNSISLDLPIFEAYLNETNEYNYSINKDGYVSKIIQIYNNKVIKNYKYQWK